MRVPFVSISQVNPQSRRSLHSSSSSANWKERFAPGDDDVVNASGLDSRDHFSNRHLGKFAFRVVGDAGTDPSNPTCTGCRTTYRSGCSGLVARTNSGGRCLGPHLARWGQRSR